MTHAPKTNGVRAWLARLAAVAAALVLSGCGSIVYKDAASTYVAAGRAVTTNLANASLTLAHAQDDQKAIRIAADASCPIKEKRLFVRSAPGTNQFAAAIGGFPKAKQSADCQAVLRCKANPAAAVCTGACYSAAEGLCIAILDSEGAGVLKDQAATESAKQAAKTLAVAISDAEYGRPAAVQSKLIEGNLTALTEYLDLLGKLTTKQESEVKADADKLAKRLDNTLKDVKELTGESLSDSAAASKTKITGLLGAAGKLLDTVKVIAADARDAAAIRKTVNERSADVNALVDSLQDVATGDARLAAAFSDLARLKQREWLQERFSAERSADRRYLMLVEDRKKFTYSDGPALTKSVTALFAAMKTSHATLVELVQNPSDDQKRAIAQAAFQEFKSIASDVAALAQLFV